MTISSSFEDISSWNYAESFQVISGDITGVYNFKLNVNSLQLISTPTFDHQSSLSNKATDQNYIQLYLQDKLTFVLMQSKLFESLWYTNNRPKEKDVFLNQSKRKFSWTVASLTSQIQTYFVPLKYGLIQLVNTNHLKILQHWLFSCEVLVLIVSSFFPEISTINIVS